MEFIIGKNDAAKLGTRIIPGDAMTLGTIIATEHIYLANIRTKNTTKEVCHFNADLNKPRNECHDEVVPGQWVFVTSRFWSQDHAEKMDPVFKAGFFLPTNDIVKSRAQISKSCYKSGNDFDACESMMLTGEFSWVDLDRSKTFVDVVNASAAAAGAAAPLGVAVGLPFGPKGITIAATITATAAVTGAAAGLSNSWTQQEEAKLKADMEANRAKFERDWAAARRAEQDNPNFMGPIRPEKPVMEIR